MKNDKPYCGGQWTEGRFRGFITSLLRSGFRRWAPKYETLKAAYTSTKLNKKSGRKAKHYLCAVCGKEAVAKQVQVDHKIPIGHCRSWNQFIERLFCEGENLQVLCKPCHKKKTKKEQSGD